MKSGLLKKTRRVWVPAAVSAVPMRARARRIMRSELGSRGAPSIDVFHGLLAANGRMIPAADVDPMVVTVEVPGTVDVVIVGVVATVAPCGRSVASWMRWIRSAA